MSDLARDVERAGRLALMKAANQIVEAADRKIGVGDPELDPDPGFALAGSAEVDLLVGDDVVVIKYPGPYAARQHEDRSAQHPRGGGPQFLADALKQEIPRLGGVVAGEVRAMVKHRH